MAANKTDLNRANLKADLSMADLQADLQADSVWQTSRPSVRAVDEERAPLFESEEEPEAEVQAVQTGSSEQKMTEVINRMLEQLAVMTSLLAKQQASTPPAPTAARPNAEPKWVCWGCGKVGHARKLSPSDPWPSPGPRKPAGNARDPQ